jgi:hypothetical protein
MFRNTAKLDDISHPLIDAAYLRRDYRGNVLVIETNFTHHKQRHQFESLLADLNGLIDQVETNVVHLDMIDIRMGDVRNRMQYAS